MKASFAVRFFVVALEKCGVGKRPWRREAESDCAQWTVHSEVWHSRNRKLGLKRPTNRQTKTKNNNNNNIKNKKLTKKTTTFVHVLRLTLKGAVWPSPASDDTDGDNGKTASSMDHSGDCSRKTGKDSQMASCLFGFPVHNRHSVELRLYARTQCFVSDGWDCAEYVTTERWLLCQRQLYGGWEKHGGMHAPFPTEKLHRLYLCCSNVHHHSSPFLFLFLSCLFDCLFVCLLVK